jgi:hypothetical protein
MIASYLAILIRHSSPTQAMEFGVNPAATNRARIFYLHSESQRETGQSRVINLAGRSLFDKDWRVR